MISAKDAAIETKKNIDILKREKENIINEIPYYIRKYVQMCIKYSIDKGKFNCFINCIGVIEYIYKNLEIYKTLCLETINFKWNETISIENKEIILLISTELFKFIDDLSYNYQYKYEKLALGKYICSDCEYIKLYNYKISWEEDSND